MLVVAGVAGHRGFLVFVHFSASANVLINLVTTNMSTDCIDNAKL